MEVIKPICIDEKIALFTDMLNVSVDCIKVIDTDGCLIFMNRSGCEALGVNVNEKEFGMEWIPLLPETFHRKGREALKKAVNGECSGFRGMSVSLDGSEIHWDNMLTPVLDHSGKTAKILCVSRNITRQVIAEKKLRVKSETDPLTGLPNRRMLKKHLKKVLSKSRDKKKQAGVMFIDLDDFKGVNDSLGHAVGDKALVQFATDLKKASPVGTFISRLGGDEFAIVMEDADVNVLSDYAAHILRGVRRKIQVGDCAAVFGLTIGAALYPRDGVNEEEIMKCADMALYQQKMNGKNGFCLFS